MSPRTDAMINGALIAIGIVVILDNFIAHWWLQLHRVLPGPESLPAEIALVILSVAAVGVGIWRERHARIINPAPRARTES